MLDDIINKYNNAAHRSIKMKPIDVTDDSYAEYKEDSNKKILNSKLVIMLELWNTKSFFRGHVISDLNGEEIARSFFEKVLQKTSQEKFRIENVLKRKGDKLYVKWKGYDNRFNSWIDKKDLEWNFLNERSHIKMS